MSNVNLSENCEHISDVAFVGCHTINNQALNKCSILKNSLITLRVNDCLNVSDIGILSLENLK